MMQAKMEKSYKQIIKNTTIQEIGKENTKSKNMTPRDNMTFYGQRKAQVDIKPSKNMYQLIRWMNLGNLSGLPRIPEFYVRCLFNFII